MAGAAASLRLATLGPDVAKDAGEPRNEVRHPGILALGIAPGRVCSRLIVKQLRPAPGNRVFAGDHRPATLIGGISLPAPAAKFAIRCHSIASSCQSSRKVWSVDSRARSSLNRALRRNTSARLAIGAWAKAGWCSVMGDVLCSEGTNPQLQLVFQLK